MISVVETSSQSGVLTAFFTAVTPLVLLFSLYIQRLWASRASKAALKAAQLIEDIKSKIAAFDSEMRVSVAILQQTSEKMNKEVNGYTEILLRNMAALARNHAIMSKNYASKTNNEEDKRVANVAEVAAISIENEYESLKANKINFPSSSTSIAIATLTNLTEKSANHKVAHPENTAPSQTQ